MAGQQPSVGRDVHYVSRGSADGVYGRECRAAKVTEVGAWLPVDDRDVDESERVLDGRRFRTVEQEWHPEACVLMVQNPTGLFFNTARHDEGQAGGTWHWPERV